MLRHAIDNGVNYVDTAFPYHGYGFDRGGESEPFVGRALRDGYRQKVQLATKLPSWLITCHADMDKYLNEQLARLETDHIDFYLVHAINKGFWKNLTAHDLFGFLDRALADGRIRHAGFRFTTICSCSRRLSTLTTGLSVRFSITTSMKTIRPGAPGSNMRLNAALAS